MGQAIINSLVNDLEAETTIASTVGTRIYPLRAPNDDLPVIVYQPSDGIRESFYRGAFGLQIDTVVLNVYTDSYDTLASIREAITSRYNGFHGAFNDGTTIQRILVNTSFYALEEGNNSVYRLTTELDIYS